ncbi:MAG: response regulator [Candidatus Omnitrophica bacterium]|nr:response regulator [Candidatus Omnitrophota bacterium]
MAKILIIDDEKGICEEFKDILEEDGHEVEAAHNGPEGIEKASQQQFDLVFLDVLMPKMEGREVLEKIKKISQVPVAIMSGYIPDNKEKEVLALGAVACLKKPLDLGKVKKLIASVAS